MLKATAHPKSTFLDLLILAFIAASIYALVDFAQQWRSEFQPGYTIDLSLKTLPIYTLYSGLRGLAALILSLIFSLIVGYRAAKSPLGERILIPLVDIGQSIPVLGFLPGLVLALIAIFPHTNTGLELASILMIFTGQVWNMTFSFYNSLKSVPHEFQEVCRNVGFSSWQQLKTVELPYSAVDLTWNCVLSMSGGWFFLCVCEAFSLSGSTYRLPGVGAYMAVAIEQNNTPACIYAIIAMATLILLLEFLLWRPLLAWIHRFRLDDIPGESPTDPILRHLVYESRLLISLHRFFQLWSTKSSKNEYQLKSSFSFLPSFLSICARLRIVKRPLLYLISTLLIGFTGFGLFHLLQLLLQLSRSACLDIAQATGSTFIRVLSCIFISSLWALPIGIWIGIHPSRVRIAQPIIQFLASFPSPMLYPLVLGILFYFHVPFTLAATILMMLGVQWYILFNVLAGALHISTELGFAAQSMNLSSYKIWTKLYLPSVFPSLVTGWVTAAGGAWNASIVAEYLTYQGHTLSTVGLGSIISMATEKADFPLLAGSLLAVTITVIFINRTLWSYCYNLAQNRFRMDL